MLGMEMMLKSLGIDPKQITDTMAALMALAQSVDTRLTAIENRLSAIEAILAPTPEAAPAPHLALVENEE